MNNNIYNFKKDNLLGWTEEEISFIEDKYIGCKYPKDIRDFLKLAGNSFYVTSFLSMKTYYVYDKFKDSIELKIKEFIKDVQFFIVGYYPEGDVVFFLVLNHCNNYKVFVNQDEVYYYENGKPIYNISFKEIASSFEEYIESLSVD
jgi:hypothetical protein